MKTATDSDLPERVGEIREALRHIHNVAKTMFVMRDQNGGDERMEGALDLLANRLENLVEEVEELFEKFAQANRESSDIGAR